LCTGRGASPLHLPSVWCACSTYFFLFYVAFHCLCCNIVMGDGDNMNVLPIVERQPSTRRELPCPMSPIDTL
jgi:hypothetical protein